MFTNSLKRVAAFGTLVLTAAVLAGCGGGGGAIENIDEGTTFDPVNGKTIFRSLENETNMDVLVDLYINDSEQVDNPFTVRAGSFINVEISGLDIRDFIQFYARFQNGDELEGSFSEDGATIFKGSRSRSVTISTEQRNGRSAVKPGPATVRHRATKK